MISSIRLKNEANKQQAGFPFSFLGLAVTA
jgi:hypothetical protein